MATNYRDIVDPRTARLIELIAKKWNERLEAKGLPGCSEEHVARSLLARAAEDEGRTLVVEDGYLPPNHNGRVS